MGIEGLAASPIALLAGLLLDALFGDPQLRYHPIRLMGSTLSWLERVLRRMRLDGYGGGCLLLAGLSLVWVVLPTFVLGVLSRWSPSAAAALHVFVIYVLFAMRDLVDHVRAVQKAARTGDLDRTREATGRLVGRDISRMDLAACRRAAIESLGESFVDGFLSALFWYLLAGLPGLLLFKVASTMDSMVGYKTPRYIRFGWCGARLDDLMNFIPARLAWILFCVVVLVSSPRRAVKGWRIGLLQHAVVPGPNAGWSEATLAGLLERRLIGPIWKQGALVTEVWLGEPTDPEGGSDDDIRQALHISLASTLLATAAGAAALFAF